MLHFLFFFELLLRINEPQSLIPYNKNGKWGFCDASKKIIITPQYEEVEPFTSDSNLVTKKTITFANVKFQGKWGLIDPQNKWLIPAKYKEPMIWDREHGRFYIQEGNYETGKGSFIMLNQEGKELLKLNGLFNWRGFDKNGIAYASINEKTGFINRDGKVLIPFQYDIWSPVTEYCYSEGLFGIGKNGKFGFVNDKNQVVIPFIFEHNPGGMGCFENGKAIVIKNGQRVLINKKGQVLQKIPYVEENSNFIEGYTLKMESASNHELLYILIDNKTQKQALPEKFNSITPEGNQLIVYKNEKYGLINLKTLKYTHPLTLTEKPVFLAMNGNAGFWQITINGLSGMIDYDGKIVIPIAYKTIYTQTLDNQKVIVNKNNNLLVIDMQNNVLKKLDYKEVKENYGSKPMTFSVTNIQDLQGVINAKGEEIIPCQYKRISNFHQIYFGLQENKKQVLFDSLGKRMQKEEFDDYEYVGFGTLGENFVRVSLNNKIGVLDKKGKFIIPCQYDNIKMDFYTEIFIIQEKDLFGLRNAEKQLITPKYTEFIIDNANRYPIQVGNKPYYLVKKGDKMGFVSLDGTEYFE
jgi:WG containing repeat